MQPNQTVVRAAMVAVTVFAFGIAGPARGEEEHPASHAKQGAVLSMTKFYTGEHAKVGDFPGKLVCLRCDFNPGGMGQCEKEGHHHALSMDSDAMIHPLLAGTEAVQKEINSAELHGKQVTVHGMYYPGTGVILADRLSAAK